MLRLDIDANRDGLIDQDEPGRWDWGWGKDKPGAIVLVDCDRDDTRDFAPADMAEIRVVVEASIPERATLVLSINAAAAGYVSIWDERDLSTPILGVNPADGSVRERNGFRAESTTLRLQALSFPNSSFDGLIEIFAGLTDGDELAETDRALFRVAPWIMPTTLQVPEEVFLVDLGAANERFREGLKQACDRVEIKLTVISTKSADGDRWIQDEIEIGYTQTPSNTMTVVLDGPRDRELDGLAVEEIARDGVGVWSVHAHLINSSLDSFGNLEVSPPVEVDGVSYPLGRIIIGTKREIGHPGEKSSLALRQFLRSQLVQAPVEIYTDWLLVGHVDEIVSFVPFDNDRGFRVLLASPPAFRSLLEGLADNDHGDALFWTGQLRRGGKPAERTVNALLDTSKGSSIDWAFNKQCSENIARVKESLKVGLNLGDDDFADVPSAFGAPQGFALAYFPGMVNHLILGDVSVVPDPYGPEIDGVDPLKAAFRQAVGSRAEGVIFVDDWVGYHEASGEVHCGTNVLRASDATVRWWELNLPGLYDASVRGRA